MDPKEALKKVNVLPKQLPDASMSTVRATQVQCEVDGGAFLLVFADLRPIAPYSFGLDRFEGNSAHVEMGRFSLSPVTFCYMKRAIEVAEKWYIDHFGALPDVDALQKKLAAEIPDRPAEIDQRMGFRR